MNINKDNQITILYATNDEYAPYMGVSIYSLIQNSSKDNYYKIYILEESLTDTHKETIQNMSRSNICIEFINVAEKMKDKNRLSSGHLTKETTFRLLVDKIFTEYEKVLYIDCDTVINNDVAILYNEDVTGYVLGVSVGYLYDDFAKRIVKEYNIPVSTYFNAGILVINIPMFRNEKIGEKCFDLLKEKGKYWAMDQDVLNITCFEKVKFIDDRWNAEWAPIAEYGMANRIPYLDDARKSKFTALDNPYILHYTTAKKPWSYPEITLAEFFWNYARKTDFYEEILFSNIYKAKDTINVEKDFFKRFIFPWDKVVCGSKIIIYGAGVVGRAFLEQIRLSQYAEILAVVDKNHNNIKDLFVPCIGIDTIDE